MTEEERIIERYKARIGNRQLLAIRAHCVECFGGQVNAIADCTSKSCALYPFRMGKQNPDELVWALPQQGAEPFRGFWTRETQSIAVSGASESKEAA